jgi:hypothetical protein
MSAKNGFLKNPLSLEENPNKLDAFNLSEQYDYFNTKINQAPNKSILALVWEYWSGKSTMLWNIEEQSDDIWITFDAWSYPERKSLWDGLILKIATDILWDLSSQKIEKKIDWDSSNKKEVGALISATATIASLATNWFDLSSLIPAWLNKIGLSFEKFLEISNSWPIFRIEWFKKIFQEILKEIWDKRITVVLEDIDRAWKEWIFFLETLFQFLKFESPWDFNIKFIVPISKKAYYEDIDSYMKCVDYFEFLNLKPEGVESYLHFVESEFDESMFLPFRRIKPLYLLAEFFYLISWTFEISFRKFWLMIRSSNERFIYLKNLFPDMPINPYIVITLEFMNYIDKWSWESKVNQLTEFVKNRKIKWDNLFWAILCISQHIDGNWPLLQSDKLTQIFATNEIKIRDYWGDIFEFYFINLIDLPPASILLSSWRISQPRDYDI